MNQQGNAPAHDGALSAMMELRFNPTQTRFSARCLMLAAAWIVSFAGCGDADPVITTPALNGCTDAMFLDRTGGSSSRVVGFGGSNGSGVFTYSPRCITIAAGQTVTFTGDFSAHPLSPGTGPMATDAGTAGTPIPRQDNNTVPMVTVNFPTVGDYPYFCVSHYAAGMVGVIHVR